MNVKNMSKAVHHSVKFSCAAFALGAVFLLLASCDDVERHRVMTLLFDGIPPLPAEGPETDVAGLNPDEAARISRTGGWYVHEPLNDCTQCHGSRRQRAFSRQVQLVAEVPQLCHNCHPDCTGMEGWVHGPVATGECLLCHEQHKARNEFLLVKPAPDLCFECHEPEAVRQVENHAEESYARCNDCHEGHVGATKSLLKVAFLKRPAGLTYLSEVTQRQYEESLRKARDDLARGRDLSDMLRTIIDDVEAGRLWPARACLEVIADSSAITDEEKRTLSEVLRQLVALTETERAGQPDGSKLDASLATLAAALRTIQDQSSERERATAERYYLSVKLYHAGDFGEARKGFLDVLQDVSIPEPMRETARGYLERIEASPVEKERPDGQRPP